MDESRNLNTKGRRTSLYRYQAPTPHVCGRVSHKMWYSLFLCKRCALCVCVRKNKYKNALEIVIDLPIGFPIKTLSLSTKMPKAPFAVGEEYRLDGG